MFEVQITIKQSTVKAMQRWNLYHDTAIDRKMQKGTIVAEDYNLWFFSLQFTIYITGKIRPKRRGDTFINMQTEH